MQKSTSTGNSWRCIPYLVYVTFIITPFIIVPFLLIHLVRKAFIAG